MIDNLGSPLNYSGNKTKLLPLIHENLPKNYKYFIDLFGGSGVVGLSQDKPVFYNEKDIYIYYLIDTIKNTDLDFLLYKIDDIIQDYELTKDSKTNYLELRKYFNNYKKQHLNSSKLGDKCIANIYLLVLCFYSFNHFITFNSKGEFNTPSGQHRSCYNKSIKNKLTKFKERLDVVDFKMFNLDFRIFDVFFKDTGNDIKDGIYFIDSPYLNSDPQYCRTYGNKWGIDEEISLYKMLDDLDKQGGKFLLTNVLRNGDEVNTYLLNFSKKYKTINTNENFINKNYQKKNHSLEILVKNY